MLLTRAPSRNVAGTPIARPALAMLLRGWLADDRTARELARFYAELRDLAEVPAGRPHNHGGAPVARFLRAAVESGRVVAFRLPSLSAGAPGARPQPSVPPPSTKPKPPPQPTAPFNLIRLDYVAFLAPGAEDPKPKIHWQIDDPSARVDRGKLEIFPSHSDKPNTPIFTHTLDAGELAHGEHELEFDGEVGAQAPFPAGYVSVEQSPYILKLTVAAGGDERTRETSFRVVATRLELELGTDALLDRKDDKEVLAGMAALGIGALSHGPIHLRSNLFPVQLTELDADGTAGYNAYLQRWGSGPRIPLVASVFFRSSQGNDVLAPKAWGRRKVLWYFDYVDQNGLVPGPSGSFVRTSADYLKDATRPKGTACHVDRGGMRSVTSPGHFRETANVSFPVARPVVLRGGRFSGPADGGTHHGKTAVLFNPARQAGDGYFVRALFDPRDDLDVEEPSAQLEQRTGTWVIRRELTVSRLFKKKGTVPEVPASAITSLPQFEHASMRLTVPDTSYHQLDETTYNDTVARVVKNSPSAAIFRLAVNPNHNQFRNGDWVVTIRSFSEFQFFAASLPATDPAKAFAVAIAQTEAGYTTFLGNLVMPGLFFEIIEALALTLSGPEGMFTLLFDGVSNQDAVLSQWLKSLPVTPLSTDISNSGFAPTTPDRHRGVACATSTDTRTLAHEMGHSLFLHHALSSNAAGHGPGGQFFMKVHSSDGHCIMNYNPADTEFCGLCQLRLRGWDPRPLFPFAPSNKK